MEKTRINQIASKQEYPTHVKLPWPKKYEEFEHVTIYDLNKASKANRINEERKIYNEKVYQIINQVRKFMDQPVLHPPNPPDYVDQVYALHDQWMSNEAKKTNAAVKYLARHKKFAEKDYLLEHAFKLACDFEATVEKRRQRSEHDSRIPLKTSEEKRLLCSKECDATWDGSSPTCHCGNLKCQWVVGNSHSFVIPDVSPVGE